MAETTIGIDPGSTVNTAALFDGSANKVPKAVLAIDNGSAVAVNVGAANPVPISDNGSSITVDGSITTVSTVTAVTAITNALPAGTNAIGKLAANSGVDIGDVDIASIAAGNNNIGDVDIASIAVGQTITDVPLTTGGLSIYHLVAAATDNATNVKASAGQVYHISGFNIGATPIYLKFHNTASTPTAGSGVVATYVIPGNTDGAGFVINIDKGLAFGTGIGITLVTGIADNNTTAVAAATSTINLGYK